MLFKSFRGEDYSCPYPELIYRDSKGTLISQILAMPKGKPIGFADAIRFASKKAHEVAEQGKLGIDPGESGWYRLNFIQFISESGFHIELTGEEFDFPFSLKTNH